MFVQKMSKLIKTCPKLSLIFLACLRLFKLVQACCSNWSNYYKLAFIDFFIMQSVSDKSQLSLFLLVHLLASFHKRLQFSGTFESSYQISRNIWIRIQTRNRVLTKLTLCFLVWGTRNGRWQFFGTWSLVGIGA